MEVSNYYSVTIFKLSYFYFIHTLKDSFSFYLILSFITILNFHL